MMRSWEDSIILVSQLPRSCFRSQRSKLRKIWMTRGICKWGKRSWRLRLTRMKTTKLRKRKSIRNLLKDLVSNRRRKR
jgi:hypothetical protein